MQFAGYVNTIIFLSRQVESAKNSTLTGTQKRYFVFRVTGLTQTIYKELKTKMWRIQSWALFISKSSEFPELFAYERL